MNHVATPEAPECKSLEWAHPLVREWFVAKFGTPTEPQELGWPHILARKNTLICAPTGSGKTLAAFLACIDGLVRKALAGDKTNVEPGVAGYLQRQRFVLDELARMHKLYGVTVIYPHEILCAGGACQVALNGVPLYRDEHHLSVYGARLIEPLLAGTL